MSTTTGSTPLLRLLPHHRRELERSGLTPRTMDMWGAYSVEADQKWVMSMLGFPHLDPPALALPILAPDLDKPDLNFVVVKPDTPRRDDRNRIVKYEVAKNSRNRLHVPLNIREKLLDVSLPVTVTEGQKKAEAGSQKGLVAIGLFGVWNWRDRIGEASFPIGDFDSIALKDRRVLLAFDSDAASNPHVGQAENDLAQFLSKRGALVAIKTLPAGPNGKVGLDDYLLKHTAQDFYELPDVSPGAPVEPLSINELTVPDMPKTVLDGRLGEICLRRLSDFPVAYAWLALLAAASQLVEPRPSAAIRTNIYSGLVGKVHSGKSVGVKRSCHLLGIDHLIPPVIVDVKAGSAEGLFATIGDRGGANVLFNPDELSHLLEKAQITNASFAYVLNSLFYQNSNPLTIAKGKAINFNACVSIVGGIVEEKFGDAFGSATTAGLYDRFLFGQCPSDFEYLYRPETGTPAFSPGVLPLQPEVNPELWEARNQIAKSEGINPRLLEIALRCAVICAAFDGRKEILATDLEPAWELARYQERVRLLLAPNPGKNFEAQAAYKVIAYLNRHAPKGEWLRLRDVLRGSRAWDYGPSLTERVINAMTFSGAIEQAEAPAPGGGRKARLIRLAGEP
ncbi:MAG: DUF3854 domain-containing protein [Candidatus Acidiferrales bacterium]